MDSIITIIIKMVARHASRFIVHVATMWTHLSCTRTVNLYHPCCTVCCWWLQVEVLAEYQLRAEEAAAQNGRQSVAVAVRQGPLLATAFHPELTKDLRW